jgi:hypothetical protein
MNVVTVICLAISSQKVGIEPEDAVHDWQSMIRMCLTGGLKHHTVFRVTSTQLKPTKGRFDPPRTPYSACQETGSDGRAV